MKTHTINALAILAALTLPLIAQSGGSLTPPSGAPGKTMKSLNQVEPRTPLIDGAPGVSVNAVTHAITISQSGSYYLTGNLSVTSGEGISIIAEGVTLDLRGFTITSSSATPSGIGVYINASHVSVFNGHIKSGTTYNPSASGNQFTGSGFNDGIYSYYNSENNNGKNIHIRDISVSGCNHNGIYCNYPTSTIVESCTVKTVGNIGIQAGVINNCVAEECGGVAIDGRTVLNCQAKSVNDDGIKAIVVSNSYGSTTGTGNTDDGIDAVYSVQNSYGSSHGGDGIQADFVFNSTGRTSGTGNSADGIDAYRSVQNSYGYSHGGEGIRAAIVSYSYGYTVGSSPSSDGIEADIAIGCKASGGENITNKYLMP